MYQCFLPIAEKLKIPVIGTISMRSFVDADFSVGLSRFPSVFLNDDEMFPRYRSPARMTFYQKITNLMQEMQIRVGHLLGEWTTKRVNEKHFSESKWNSVKLSLLFTNDHEIFSPRAKPANSINIGGIHVKSSSLKPLPEVSLGSDWFLSKKVANFAIFCVKCATSTLIYSLKNICIVR